MDRVRALRVFAEGFAVGRGFTFGCVGERVGDLFVIRDEPLRAGHRVSEVVGWGCGPEEVLKVGGEHGGERWAACVVGDDLVGKKSLAGYKEAGFRRVRREPFFAFDLLRGGAGSLEGFGVRRVVGEGDAERIRVLNGGRKVLREEDLGEGDAEIRTYFVEESGEVAGWVSSVRVGADGWVAGLFVRPEFRQRGIGERLMRGMLADDRRFGVETSVLLASRAGARLYPRVGYEQIGLLHVMYPPGYRAKGGG